jgi:hypothetical protein
MKFNRAVLAAAVAALGCSNNSLAPFQPEIRNLPDNYEFQATALTNVTTTVQYTWQNSGASATINHSSVVTTGTATLTVKDANGTTVYSGALVASGTPTTTAGVAGAWTIRVDLVDVSGTLNFRVQKL